MTEPEDPDDGTDWAEVARLDREMRGECWFKVNEEGQIIDGWCEVHLRVHGEDE